MYKIAIIGEKDITLGFKSMGIDVFPITQSQEAEVKLKELIENNYIIIYIFEKIAKDILSTIEEYNKTEASSVIIPIPDNQGSIGLGIQGVKKSVERAVGADILFQTN